MDFDIIPLTHLTASNAEVIPRAAIDHKAINKHESQEANSHMGSIITELLKLGS